MNFKTVFLKVVIFYKQFFKKSCFRGRRSGGPGRPGAPKWYRWTQGVPTNWPDRVGAVGRGMLRFGAALCARKPSSRRSENHCI